MATSLSEQEQDLSCTTAQLDYVIANFQSAKKSDSLKWQWHCLQRVPVKGGIII